MTEPIIISEAHPRSHRSAVLADEGTSIWLYLTEPKGNRPVADCWLLNTVPAPTDITPYRGNKGAPPATRQYVTAESQGIPPAASAVKFQWSADGESVAVWISGASLGFIASGHKRGFSRHLIANGPYGQPWNEQLYVSLFGK